MLILVLRPFPAVLSGSQFDLGLGLAVLPSGVAARFRAFKCGLLVLTYKVFHKAFRESAH